MFINNCLVSGGADLTLRVPSEQVTYIFDNEPRNKEIIKRMQKVIDDGYNSNMTNDCTTKRCKRFNYFRINKK